MHRALVFAVLLPFAARAETAEEVLAQAKADCARLEGQFQTAPGTVTKVDLTGDGKLETIIDGSGFSCDTPGFALQGQGAGSLWVVGEGLRLALLARSWRVVQTGAGPALRLWLGGIEAFDGTVPPHPETLAWDPETRSFTSVAAP